MNNLKALMEKRNAKVDELKAILNVALEETRAFTEEEKEQRCALENEIAELNDTIEILKNDRYNDSKKVEEDEEDIKMAEIRSERELQNVQLVNYLAGKDMMNGITKEGSNFQKFELIERLDKIRNEIAGYENEKTIEED